MVAHFINMGQADSTLLEFPCGAILVDAGSQDGDHTKYLLDYLDEFFAGRDDLARTLAAVFITHNHIDHTRALRPLAEHDPPIIIERYIDNGMREGKGGAASAGSLKRSKQAAGVLCIVRCTMPR